MGRNFIKLLGKFLKLTLKIHVPGSFCEIGVHDGYSERKCCLRIIVCLEDFDHPIDHTCPHGGSYLVSAEESSGLFCVL